MDYKTITGTIDAAAANYAAVVNRTERKLLEKALTEAKALETDSAGKLKLSLANLRRLGDIKVALAKAASNKGYLKGVSDLAKAIGQIEAEQMEYYSTAFGAKSISDSFKDKAEYVKKLAVKNTIDGLTGAGLDAGVLNGIYTLLMKAVTTSSSYADLTDQLYQTLISSETKTSSFARYANTYATTAMTQYAGQNNKMFTDDLDIKWFRYVGSNIETTRPFCEALTAKEWIYITEIPEILAGKIDQNGTIKTLPLNPKTNLPYGLIEGTTPDNFMVNVGGWNCRHQLVPVAAAAVPQNIRDRFEPAKPAKKEAKKKEEKKATPPTPAEPTILKNLCDMAIKNKVSYKAVELLKKQLSDEEIISRISGGDMTKGSCASLGLAYIANKYGYDVLDFRDGSSRSFFASKANLRELCQKVGGATAKNTSDIAAAKELFSNMVIGKEYYFVTGKHAAIVRRTASGMEYLELQSGRENGFQPFTSLTLRQRFGAKRSHSSYGYKFEVDSFLIDIELIGTCKDIQTLMGYINTAEGAQMKGKSGSMK